MSDALAISGGEKAVKTKLPGWPQFSEEAIRAVEAVLRSGKVNYWTGPRGIEFEKRFAEWQGSKYAISVATGTAALRWFRRDFHRRWHPGTSSANRNAIDIILSPRSGQAPSDLRHSSRSPDRRP